MKNKSIAFFLIATLAFNSSVYADDFFAPATILEETSGEIEEKDTGEVQDQIMDGISEEIEEAQEPTESVDIQIETENTESASAADVSDAGGDTSALFDDGTSGIASIEANTSDSANDSANPEEEGQNIYQGFVYEENEDGTLSITGYCGEEKEHLVVPETINGKEVTWIKAGFADSVKDSLISIKIPGVVEIDSGTFESFEKLESVEAPKVTQLGNGTFRNCYSLKNVNLEQCTLMKGSNFINCKALEEINLPNVTRTGEIEFPQCTSLKSVQLPKLKGIGIATFARCTSLKSIYLPSATWIGPQSFAECFSLESVDVPNATGVAAEAFLRSSALKNVHIPNVTEIWREAFSGCSSLKNIQLPKVECIMAGAFQNCSSLETIDLSSATEIYDRAFINCLNLKTAIFSNSLDSIGDFAFGYAVEDGYDPNNESEHIYRYPGNLTVYCPSGSVAWDYANSIGIPIVLTGSAQEITLDTPKLNRTVSADAENINLNWSKVPNADGYRIYIKSDGKWQGLGNTRAVSYTYTKAKAGQTYTFTVRAYKKAASGYVWSDYDKNGITATALAAPKLNKSVSADAKNITLNWTKVPNADGYRVFVRSNGKWTGLTNTTASFYRYSNAKAGQTYIFTVRAYKKTASGYVWSSYDEGGVAGSTLNVPKLSKAAATGTGKITLNWTKAADADGYRVFVKANGKWQGIANTTASSYTYSKAKSGRTYTFTVRAYKKTGSGYTWSSYEKTGITGTALDTPKLNKIRRPGTRAAISWKKVSGSTGYVVYRKAGTGQWKRVGIVTNGTSFTDRNLKKGTKYTYTVRAYVRANGKSTYSSYDKKGLSVMVR